MSLSNIKVNNSQIIGIDDEPISDSKNLIKSGGIFEKESNINFKDLCNIFDLLPQIELLNGWIDGVNGNFHTETSSHVQCVGYSVNRFKKDVNYKLIVSNNNTNGAKYYAFYNENESLYYAIDQQKYDFVNGINEITVPESATLMRVMVKHIASGLGDASDVAFGTLLDERYKANEKESIIEILPGNTYDGIIDGISGEFRQLSTAKVSMYNVKGLKKVAVDLKGERYTCWQ